MSTTRASPALSSMLKKHPLQRMYSPSRTASAVIHTLGLASFAYSFVWLETHPNHINQSYGWHFQYLTIIGLTLATLTFILGILSDMTYSRRLFYLKNLTSMCSAPMETLISLLYWGLRAIDPALVVPPELELPLATDLSFHAIPTLMLLVDLLLLSPPWTISAVPALTLSAVIAFTYWFWIELCFSKNGFYPYPLFDVLNSTQRVALFGSSAVVMTGSTIMIKWLYRQINGGSDRTSRPGNIRTSGR